MAAAPVAAACGVLAPSAASRTPRRRLYRRLLTGTRRSPRIKAALAKVRESRKQRLADRLKAQADLRDVLSLRQEAALVMGGMLE